MMTPLKTFALFFFVQLVSSSLEVTDQTCEQEVDSSSRALLDSAPQEVSITFHNDGARDLELLWFGNGNRVPMGVITGFNAMPINSFSGHQFIVTAAQEISSNSLTTTQNEIVFTVDLKQKDYRFMMNEFGEIEKTVIKEMSSKEREQKQNDDLIASFRTTVPVKFRNLSNRTVSLWYDDGQGGQRQGIIPSGSDTGTNSYPGHVFCFAEYDVADKGCDVAKGKVSAHPDTYTYVFDDDTAPEKVRRLWEEEKAFDQKYFAETGRHWLNYYPRPPPKLHMWPAEKIGQKHVVSSKYGFTESQENSTFELEVISAQPGPRVFLIKNLFSDDEAAHIIEQGLPKVARSMTGQAEAAFESSTRTSKTGWLGRTASPTMERIFRRAGDVLNIDHDILRPEKNAELLQVVHYDPEQKYDAHHDWGVDDHGQSRFATLLLYLNTPIAGGQTSFPKAMGADGKPIAVHPGKGSAVLFYDLLEDGNADDFSLHAALPVIEGEKWLANFWIWDPKYPH